MPSFLFLDCAAIIRVDADLRMNSTMKVKTRHEKVTLKQICCVFLCFTRQCHISTALPAKSDSGVMFYLV